MITTELMLQGIEDVTGIKLERDAQGYINMSKFMEEYRQKFPEQYRKKFGDMNTEQAIKLFINQKFGTYEK
jgi:hypothetical protein